MYTDWDQSFPVSDPYETLRETDIGPLIEEYGEIELSVADDLFERMVISVVNQLISTEAARTIRGQLFDEFAITPDAMLAADDVALRSVGLSPQKIEYIKSIARWSKTENITADSFSEMDDEAVIDELTTIRGVGEWTAKMTLMFGLGREDVFPVEDLAVRRGMEQYFGDETRAEMRSRAAQWTPYRSYATLYIWKQYVRENSSVEDIVVE